jgi:STE24 endopeptidase
VRGLSRRAVLGPALLALGSAELAVRLLSPRQRPPEPVGVDLRSYFSEDEIERGARFARPQLALALSRAMIQLAVIAGAARRSLPAASPPSRRLLSRWPPWLRPASHLPPRPASRSVSRSTSRPAEAARGAGVAASLAITTTAASLPLAAVSRRRAIAVGLVTQSWRGWAGDLAKATVIETGLAGIAGGAVAYLTERYPRGWWLPAAAGSVGFGTVLGALAPVLLDPLFNDFTPLPAGELRTDILELADKAGVKVGEVYSIDASRRTTAANAYVSGLGPTKRVVLFDTLLDRYSRDEVLVVVAHELSHVRHRDVVRGVLYGAIVAAPAALATQRLSWAISPRRSGAAALPALALAATLAAAPTGLLGNRLSRAIERRADAYALELSGQREAFISFERTIALQNVADLDPPAWVTRLLATHPSTAQRIGAALAVA